MPHHSPSVSDALSGVGAHLRRSGTPGPGLSLAEWSNGRSRTRYDRPGHHTLSLYLEGGQQVIREDCRHAGGGAPDKLCLLPAEHESRWTIGGPLRMFHLYITPEQLAYRALTGFDIDPRGIDLRDLTFADDPVMAMLVRGAVLPLDWSEASDRLALDSACHLLVHHLLRRHLGQDRGAALRGGLSPAIRRRIADLIEAALDQPLGLDRLAEEAGLSSFHFAKMFRTSFGLPPHRYLALRRIARARSLLGDPSRSIAQVALDCGYGSQSHFSRAFKAAVGVTPGAFRQGGAA